MSLREKMLTSLAVSILGLAASIITGEWHESNSLPTMIGLVIGFIFSYVVLSLIFAAAVWAIGRALLGPLSRSQFQKIFLVTSITLQLLAAVISTYALYRAGLYENLALKQVSSLWFFFNALPYCATIISTSIALDDNLISSGNSINPLLGSVDSELKMELTQREGALWWPVLICVISGAILGWLFLPLDAPIISIIAGGAFGIPAGMLIFRYLPGQRKLRSLESIRNRLHH